MLDDEDLTEEIRAHMIEKGTTLKAEDVIKIVTSPDMQASFAAKGITKAKISVSMALRWFEKLG